MTGRVIQVSSLSNFHMAWHTSVFCGHMDKLVCMPYFDTA
ncbi:hypothetical protein F383_10724 [Gossypium arboreum]|uniref:Uncharacterized protein n=1 Tax=Gossypium arboreum TaxID=29729 RepID=A0A0B0P7X3_GOSAR|nr:hypothetical protein F383_10724 [Gossypium arboreum]